MTVVSARGSGVTRAVTFDIFKAFKRVSHGGLFHKLNFYRISDRIFALIVSFLSSRRLQVVHGGRVSQEDPTDAGFLQRSIFRPILFLLYRNDLPDGGICNFCYLC